MLRDKNRITVLVIRVPSYVLGTHSLIYISYIFIMLLSYYKQVSQIFKVNSLISFKYFSTVKQRGMKIHMSTALGP